VLHRQMRICCLETVALMAVLNCNELCLEKLSKLQDNQSRTLCLYVFDVCCVNILAE